MNNSRLEYVSLESLCKTNSVLQAFSYLMVTLWCANELSMRTCSLCPSSFRTKFECVSVRLFLFGGNYCWDSELRMTQCIWPLGV